MRVTSILSVVLMFFLSSITFADEWEMALPHSMLHMDSALKEAFNDSKCQHEPFKVTKLLRDDATVVSTMEDWKNTEEKIPSIDNHSPLHTSKRGIVNGNKVNLRYGPSLEERVILTLIGKGKPVEVYDRQGDWYRVKAGDDEGWIYATFVNLEQAEATSQQKIEEHTMENKKSVASPILAKAATDKIAAKENNTPNKTVLKDSTIQSEDLLQIYKLAQENDPTFQREVYRHEASPETLKQAYSEILPTVSADASYQRTRQEINETSVAVYGQDLARYPSKGYNLTLIQPILRYSSFMRILQAKEEVKQADFEFEKAKQDLILRVVEAYIGSLEAKDNLESTRAEEDAIKLHFELAQERYKSGLAPITDFHDAKARFAYIRAQRVKAEDLLDDALEALAELTGQKINNLAKLKFATVKATSNLSKTLTKTESKKEAERHQGEKGMPLMAPDPDDITNWIDAALEQNLEVHIQQQAVLVAEREIERQRGGHWPTLEVVGRVNRDDEGGSLFGGESDVETREAILQLNVPIFQGLSVLSKTREAQKLYKAAKQNLEKEIRFVKRGTRAAFLGVKSAIKNTEALRQSVVSHQIALEAKRQGFKSGVYHILAVLDAERDFHQAKLEYARAQYEYILNSIRLKKAVGTLNEEDLAGVNQWLE